MGICHRVRLRIAAIAGLTVAACSSLPSFFNDDSNGDGGSEASLGDASDGDGGDAATCVDQVRAPAATLCAKPPTTALAVARGPLSSVAIAASKTDLFYVLGRTLVRRPLSAFGVGPVHTVPEGGADSSTGQASDAAPLINLSLDACPLDVLYTFGPGELERLVKLIPFGDSGVCVALRADRIAADASPDAAPVSTMHVVCSRDGRSNYVALDDAVAQSGDALVKAAGPVRLVDGYAGILYWVSELPQTTTVPRHDAVFQWVNTSIPSHKVAIGAISGPGWCTQPNCAYAISTVNRTNCLDFPTETTHFSAGAGMFETLSGAPPPNSTRKPCNVPTWTALDGASAGIEDGFSTSIRAEGLLGFDTKSGASLRITSDGDAVFRGRIVPVGQPVTTCTSKAFDPPYQFGVPPASAYPLPVCTDVPNVRAYAIGKVPLARVDLKGRKVISAASAGEGGANRFVALVTQDPNFKDFDVRIGRAGDRGPSSPYANWEQLFSNVSSSLQGGSISVIGIGNEFLVATTPATGANCTASDGFIARFAQ